MLSTYELALILSTKEEKAGISAIKKIIEKSGAKVSSEETWGKKSLSYPIKKQNEGIYFFLMLEAPGNVLGNLSNSLRTHEAILRYLLLKKENKKGDIVAKKESKATDAKEEKKVEVTKSAKRKTTKKEK